MCRASAFPLSVLTKGSDVGLTLVTLPKETLYIINSVVKTKLPYINPHRSSTIVSSETWPLNV